MAPLKSLERDYPLIDSIFQNFCASHELFTVEDFLVHDFCLFAALVEQNNNSEQLKQDITQVFSIIDSRCQPWLNGLELLNDVEQNKFVLSTGCERVSLHPISFPDLNEEIESFEVEVGNRIVEREIVLVEVPPEAHNVLFDDNVAEIPGRNEEVIIISSDDEDDSEMSSLSVVEDM